MEEGQAKNEFKPPVVEETVVESETVVSKESAASGAPVFKDERKKMSGGVIACIVILAVLASGGIGFGVWAMLSQNDKIASLETDLANCAASNNSSTENVEVTCPDGTSTEIVKNVITNDLAQSLIRPYIGMIGYYGNILSLGFNDDTKFYVAYDNLNDNAIFNPLDGGNQTISYYTINNEYKYLFGSDENVENRDYNVENVEFSYIANENNSNNSQYEIIVKGIGGVGSAMFDVVKGAKYDGDNILVDVYHDKNTVCDINYNDGYCVDTDKQGAVVDSIDQYNMRDLIEKFADRIPVYTMTFVKDDGHYVLNNIQKQ